MQKILENIWEKLSPLGWKALGALIIILVGWVVIKLVEKAINKIIEKRNANTIVLGFVKTVVHIALWVLVLMTALDKLDVSMTPLVSVFTVAAAGFVLAFKESLSGVVDGIMIAFAKPFEQGDLIEVNGVKGKIQNISLLYTFLLTLDNRKVIIPNDIIAHSTIINYSSEEIRRVDITVSVAYGSDLKHVVAVVMDAAKRNPFLPEGFEPIVRVISFDESGITVEVRCFAKPVDFEDCRTALIDDIHECFRKEHIEIPYNKLDVYVKS